MKRGNFSNSCTYGVVFHLIVFEENIGPDIFGSNSFRVEVGFDLAPTVHNFAIIYFGTIWTAYPFKDWVEMFNFQPSQQILAKFLS